MVYVGHEINNFEGSLVILFPRHIHTH
jgi:hypothetical protein